MSHRPKVLFFTEDATMAHTGRILTLAQALDPTRYEAVIACGLPYRRFALETGLAVVHLETLGVRHFSDAIAKGAPLLPLPQLQRLVANDLALISRESPQLLVGDFRCSLGISAELTQLPYLAISNGAWSPRTSLRFPLPELPVVRWLGVPLASLVVRLATPMIFRQHLAPFNAMRRMLGLSPLGSLRELYTHASHTLYTDLPELAPTTSLPANHEYLGPVSWEPPVEQPSWWNVVPQDRPIVYATLGSSGDPRMVRALIEGLAREPVTVLLATAGKNVGPLPDHFFAAPYLSGSACAARAQLVICNGGSGSIYQALEAGLPVLGIPSNADQYLCMNALQAQGAGRLIRAGQVSASRVTTAVRALLSDASIHARAKALQTRVHGFDARAHFAQTIARYLPTSPALPNEATGSFARR